MFYDHLKREREYAPDLEKCIQETVENLLVQVTDASKPGLLLGKIQSGKTRAFIGIIALAFDKGYDVAVVLTKGTRALAEQTLQRLEAEFEYFINLDELKVYNIMTMPPELTKYVRRQKMIFVVKKEHQNMKRLQQLFTETYPDMSQKQVLIIDDEADFASIGYKKSNDEEEELEYRVLAKLINDFRSNLSHKSDFLQVTATPYSLYLQPEEINMGQHVYKPMRPVFTSLLPIHDAYIGSEFYFEDATDSNSIASFLHVPVNEKEFEVLGVRHERYLNTILETDNLKCFRKAFVTFLVGGSIRMLQEKNTKYKCSFLIHTESMRKAHNWQFDLAVCLKNKLIDLCKSDVDRFGSIISESYEDLTRSVLLNGSALPSLKEVQDRVRYALNEEEIGMSEINSDNDIRGLLNKFGQLKLDNPFNIFIGGQILDRGITIDSLIGFFYGRNPKRFQQDTVLQHSRMYGARSKSDLAVTRFYTSARIYQAMKAMHEFDNALRSDFEAKRHTEDVVFVHKDSMGKIIPCAPNKILITNTTTIRPRKRLFPRGIQTKARTHIEKNVEEIHTKLSILANGSFEKHFLMDIVTAFDIIDAVNNTYEWSDRELCQNLDYEWDTKSFKSVMQYVSTLAPEPLRGRVYCLVKLDRDATRYKAPDIFTTSPDGGTDRNEAKKIANELPLLLMLKQKGYDDSKFGWRGAQFWWPVLYLPESTPTAIFASELIDE
ncbi:DEAD/DEAH box helicase [bacterium]|nr:DEAD/DEAH box helicase [bacterium]